MIEKDNPEPAKALPKNCHVLDRGTLAELLKVMASIPFPIRLGTCPGMVKRRRTTTSIVRLIVEILEPYHGCIFDPACGSGGMFIQSARFVEAHQKNPTAKISVHGLERVTDTARLARLNLAVHECDVGSNARADIRTRCIHPKTAALV